MERFRRTEPLSRPPENSFFNIMSTTLIIAWSVSVFVLLMALMVETIREFNRMDHRPGDFSGSDRLAGSAE